MPKNLGLYNENLSIPRKKDIDELSEKKQDKITGSKGQIVGFDEDGGLVAQSPYKVINFGPQTSGQAFTITTEQMNEMLSDYPPVVTVEIEGMTISLRRYDKVGTVAYYSNVMYSQGIKYFVSMQATETTATITNAEEIQIPTPQGVEDNKKILQVNQDGGFDIVSLEQADIASIAQLDKKADKKVPSTANNIALLGSDGNLVDSGKGLEDIGGISQSVIDEIMKNLGTKGKNARIAVGSYVGTGRHGQSNPNQLTFDFYPVLVFCQCAKWAEYPPCIFIRGLNNSCSSVPVKSPNEVTWSEKGLSWYHEEHQDSQNNSTGKTYCYVVIGYDKDAEA